MPFTVYTHSIEASRVKNITVNDSLVKRISKQQLILVGLFMYRVGQKTAHFHLLDVKLI